MVHGYLVLSPPSPPSSETGAKLLGARRTVSAHVPAYQLMGGACSETVGLAAGKGSQGAVSEGGNGGTGDSNRTRQRGDGALGRG